MYHLELKTDPHRRLHMHDNGELGGWSGPEPDYPLDLSLYQPQGPVPGLVARPGRKEAALAAGIPEFLANLML